MYAVVVPTVVADGMLEYLIVIAVISIGIVEVAFIESIEWFVLSILKSLVLETIVNESS